MDKILSRLKQPSTYAGLMGLALVLGGNSEDFKAWADAAAGFFGFLAIVIGEGEGDGA